MNLVGASVLALPLASIYQMINLINLTEKIVGAAFEHLIRARQMLATASTGSMDALAKPGTKFHF